MIPTKDIENLTRPMEAEEESVQTSKITPSGTKRKRANTSDVNETESEMDRENQKGEHEIILPDGTIGGTDVWSLDRLVKGGRVNHGSS